MCGWSGQLGASIVPMCSKTAYPTDAVPPPPLQYRTTGVAIALSLGVAALFALIVVIAFLLWRQFRDKDASDQAQPAAQGGSATNAPATKLPTPPSVITNLPCLTYQASRSCGRQDNAHQCVVCCCEYEQQDKVKVLPCLHMYHAECIDRWLAQDSVCPICQCDVAQAAKSPQGGWSAYAQQLITTVTGASALQLLRTGNVAREELSRKSAALCTAEGQSAAGGGAATDLPRAGAAAPDAAQHAVSSAPGTASNASATEQEQGSGHCVIFVGSAMRGASAVPGLQITGRPPAAATTRAAPARSMQQPGVSQLLAQCV